ncbi:hypothetical protein BaRGS_00008605 [Batillaria attramentaria]|uniref:Uncharacterized protein n=1 Tax=Batillaria attramentaria TaxID=370345 RepID=A0ABD0LM34_9CAEN
MRCMGKWNQSNSRTSIPDLTKTLRRPVPTGENNLNQGWKVSETSNNTPFLPDRLRSSSLPPIFNCSLLKMCQRNGASNLWIQCPPQRPDCCPFRSKTHPQL